MKEYYAYYSYGGYKDMWLGDDKRGEERSYYSPFKDSDIDQLGLSGTQLENLRQQLDALRGKTLIKADYDGGGSGMAAVHNLVANGGYKIALVKLGDGRFAVIVRDINGQMKDDMGRSIPYVLYVVMDSAKDAVAFANYLMDSLERIDDIFGGLFVYDSGLNCLSFRLAEMDRIMARADECGESHYMMEARACGSAYPEILMMVTNNRSGMEKVLRSVAADTRHCRFFDYGLRPLNEVRGDAYAFVDDVNQSSSGKGNVYDESSRGFGSMIRTFVKGLEEYVRKTENMLGHIFSDADREDLANIKRSISNIKNRWLKRN